MPNRLLRDVVFVLAAKLVALTIIYLLFFSAMHQPKLGPSQVAHWLLGPGASSTER